MKLSQRVSALLFLSALVLFPALAHGDENVVIKAKNGEFQISLPSIWINADTIFADTLCQISAADPSHDCFLAIASMHSDDFKGDFLQHAQDLRDLAIKKLQDVNVGDGKQFQLNNWNCIQYEIHGTSIKEQIRLAVVLTVIKTDKHILVFVDGCGDSGFDKYGDTLRNLSTNLTEIDNSQASSN